MRTTADQTAQMRYQRVQLSLDFLSKTIRIHEFAAQFKEAPADGSFDKGDLIGLIHPKRKARKTQYRLDFRATIRKSVLLISCKELARLEASLDNARQIYGDDVNREILIGVFFHKAFGSIVFTPEFLRVSSKANEMHIHMYPCSD